MTHPNLNNFIAILTLASAIGGGAYALADSGESRWLTTYNAHPEPQVVERLVDLKAGESIRPDAGRLVRTRPGWDGNPNTTTEGVPCLLYTSDAADE